MRDFATRWPASNLATGRRLIGGDADTGRFELTFPTDPLRLEVRRRVGDGANRLVLADNLAFLRSLPDAFINLVYIDPPFATGQRRTSPRSNTSYGDSRPRDLAEYLGWLNARLSEIRRVMAPAATLYVHLDWHVVHYVKVELDKLFGAKNFRNEIVWHYNSGPRSRSDFGRRHDLILRYTKSDRYVFNPDAVRQPYSPDINIPASKRHYYHPLGKVMDDVWRIPIIAQNDKTERLGYPTQKPGALLDLIIRASSNEGDLVADFFCGSGTTLAIAARLGRRWLGCDDNPEAIAIAEKRLASNLWGGSGFVVESRMTRRDE
jgi:adenine-specific DNA-methyltransferase